MELALMVEGQEGVSWDDWVALARACEDAGVGTLFRSDHYLGLAGDESREVLDAWTTIAGLAAITERLRFGTLVSPVTFRHPSVLAKQAATADHISGGRVELGMGAAWNRREHAAYGFPFPPVGERYDVFEEQVEIVRRLLTDDEVSFSGGHYRLEAVRPRPAPLQSPLPLLVGGNAGPRSARIAAAWADEYNTIFATVEELRARRRTVAAAWRGAGRDPGSLRFSLMTGLCVGRDRDELHDRAARVLERSGRGGEDPATLLEERRGTWIVGTVDEAVEQLRARADAGVDRVMLQHLAHRDLDAVRLIGEELAPAVP